MSARFSTNDDAADPLVGLSTPRVPILTIALLCSALLMSACGGGGDSDGDGADPADEVAPATEPVATTAPAEPTAAAVVTLLADDLRLGAGECTRLEWSAEGAARAYLDGEGVEPAGERQACPETTTTYELVAAFADGSQESRTVTVEVEAPEPTATDVPPPTAAAPTAVPATAAPTETAAPAVAIDFYPSNGVHEIDKDDLCTSVHWTTAGVTKVQLERNADGRLDVGASGSEEACFNERKVKYTLYFVMPDGSEDRREIEISRKN